MTMGQREYIVAIDGDQQYRTDNRLRAKVFYQTIDETFERDVDGHNKQLIQVEADGWTSKILLQDMIHCAGAGEEKEKQDFRVIVAGCRDFDNYEVLRDKCDSLLSRKHDRNIIIVSGHATGADSLGERYARERGYKVELYPADWAAHGKAAGPIRNAQMADNADALIAFWDGESRGTKNMIDTATRQGLSVRVVDIAPEEELEEDIEEEQPVRRGWHR